jgi:predicted nucleic acid-binding Zn ribbon protein
MKPLNSAVPGALAQLLREAPLSDGKVAFAWKVAVGPAVERATAIKLQETTLIVDVASAQWANEVKRSSAIILARLQTLLGRTAVAQLQVRSR